MNHRQRDQFSVMVFGYAMLSAKLDFRKNVRAGWSLPQYNIMANKKSMMHFAGVFLPGSGGFFL